MSLGKSEHKLYITLGERREGREKEWEKEREVDMGDLGTGENKIGVGELETIIRICYVKN